MSLTQNPVLARATERVRAAGRDRAWKTVYGKLFSFPVMLAVLLALVMCWSASKRFNDPDLWWHLKTGQTIWETGSFPTADHLSYTTGNHAWIPHGWLAEVSMYAFFKAGGHTMLMLWLWLASSVFGVAVYVLCSLYSGNAKVSLLGGMIGWFFSTIGLAIRPLILGHLFLVLELVFVYLARARDRRWLWALPPLFVVWVNCHGSFLLGLVVLGIVVVCSYINLEAGLLVSRRWDAPSRHLLSAILPLCVLALLVNPFGLELATYPLNLLLLQTDNLKYIVEWDPLNFQEPRGLGVFVVTALIGLLVLLRKKRLELQELFLLLLALFSVVRHTRMLFAFGILVAPIFCRLLADLWRAYDPRHDLPRLNAAVIAGAICLIVFRFPAPDNIQKQIRQANPVAAVEFIREQSLSGRMLNDYGWGGYLIWALPEHKVFVDGRTDIYDWTGVLEDYVRWHQLRDDPELLLNQYRVDFCLLNKDAPIAKVLPLLPSWHEVYSDNMSVIFARDSSAAPEERLTARAPGHQGTAGSSDGPLRAAVPPPERVSEGEPGTKGSAFQSSF